MGEIACAFSTGFSVYVGFSAGTSTKKKFYTKFCSTVSNEHSVLNQVLILQLI